MRQWNLGNIQPMPKQGDVHLIRDSGWYQETSCRLMLKKIVLSGNGDGFYTIPFDCSGINGWFSINDKKPTNVWQMGFLWNAGTTRRFWLERDTSFFECLWIWRIERIVCIIEKSPYLSMKFRYLSEQNVNMTWKRSIDAHLIFANRSAPSRRQREDLLPPGIWNIEKSRR